MRLYQRGKRGTWYVDFTVPGRPRFDRSAGTSNRRQAEEWAAQQHAAEWRFSKLGERPEHTWGEAVADWLVKHGHERRSIEDIKDRLRWLTKHIGEDTRLRTITRSFVERVMQAKRDEGIGGRSRSATKPRQVSPKTLTNHVAEVSKILNHARALEWIESVPVLRTYLADAQPIAWLTRTQADRLIAELPEHLARMAELALATGMREANVRLLQWHRVDVARRIAWVEGLDAKAKKPIAIPLNADALRVLEQQRGKHAAWVFPVVTKRRIDGEVKLIVGPVSGCSTRAWYKATERADVPGFRWHDLRHTWASWHVQGGTPLPILMQLGGWASLDMVLRYAHLGRDHTAAWADAVSRDNYAADRGTGLAQDAQAVDSMGWLMGLEPTTTGITTRDSTN